MNDSLGLWASNEIIHVSEWLTGGRLSTDACSNPFFIFEIRMTYFRPINSSKTKGYHGISIHDMKTRWVLKKQEEMRLFETKETRMSAGDISQEWNWFSSFSECQPTTDAEVERTAFTRVNVHSQSIMPPSNPETQWIGIKWISLEKAWLCLLIANDLSPSQSIS